MSTQNKSGLDASTGVNPQWLALERLHLDTENPRFGARLASVGDESRVLDEIVESHGIKDVLSSLAANGFFSSEPLVGAVNKGREEHDVVILEGNRRLAACLILADDPRADVPGFHRAVPGPEPAIRPRPASGGRRQMPQRLQIVRVWSKLRPVALRHVSAGIMIQSGRQDLNLRPLDPQSSALPSCATPRVA